MFHFMFSFSLIWSSSSLMSFKPLFPTVIPTYKTFYGVLILLFVVVSDWRSRLYSACPSLKSLTVLFFDGFGGLSLPFFIACGAYDSTSSRMCFNALIPMPSRPWSLSLSIISSGLSLSNKGPFPGGSWGCYFCCNKVIKDWRCC